MKKFVLAASFSALLAYPAFAHHPSGVSGTGDAGPIGTVSASTLEEGQSAAALIFEMVKITAFSDAQFATFAGQHEHVHSLDSILAPSLVYAYGVTRDFTLVARLPYIARQDIREGTHAHGAGGIALNGVDELGDADGIGDFTLLGQYRFYNNLSSRTEAALLLGVKAPTGPTGLRDNMGERFETEFQPGSGSWDGLFGLAVTQRLGSWSLDGNLLYQLASTGAQDTDMGDRLLYNAAISYRVVGGPAASGRMNAGALPEPMYHGGPASHEHQHSHDEPPVASGPALDAVLELNGEWHGHQVIGGVKDANSGGNVVYLSPGLRLSLDKWSGFVSVGMPVLNHLYGTQAEPDWRLITGVAVSF